MNIKLERIIISVAVIMILGAIGIQNKDNLLYNNKDAKYISVSLSNEDSLSTTKNTIKEEKSIENTEIVNQKININTASKDELMTLEGIGEKTADAIIIYRNNKKFENIEEIKNVKGIGDKKYEAISENITI